MSSGKRESLETLREGLMALQKGSLYIIIAYIADLIGGVLVNLFAFHMYGYRAAGTALAEVMKHIFSMLGAIGTLILVSGILSLLAWLKWRTAGKLLGEYDKRLHVGATGALLVIIGAAVAIIDGLVVIAGFLARMPAVSLAGLGAIIIAGLLVLVGGILFSIMLIRLGDSENMLRIAGIMLLIAAILVPVSRGLSSALFIVAAILVYIGSSSVLERVAPSV